MGGTHANVLQHIEHEFEAAATGRQGGGGDAAQPPPGGGVRSPSKRSKDAVDDAEVWAEYDRLVDQSKTHAVGWRRLRAMRQIEGLRLDFTHLGILFALDVGLTGTFALTGLQGFAYWCANISAKLGEAAFAHEVQTRTLLRLWKDHVDRNARGEVGEDAFAEWLLAVVVHSSDGYAAGGQAGGVVGPDPLFPDADPPAPLLAPPADASMLTTAQLRVLYLLLGSADTALDVSDFVQLCTMAELEAQGLTPAPDAHPAQSPAPVLVSVDVVRPFVRQFARSHFGNLAKLGLEPLLDTV